MPGPRFATLPLFALLLAPVSVAAQTSGLDAARVHREARGAQIVAELAELLAIPNVASDSVGIRRNARWIVDAFAERGFSMELVEHAGAPPVVRGERTTPGADRTLGLYVHYDGQPADTTRWTHGPWEPILYTAPIEAGGEPRALPAPGEPVDPEWRIYARSAGDDKAPVVALLAALDALDAADVPLTSDVELLFEGEEEAGSPHLPAILAEHGDRWDDVDAWLFLDGPMHASGRPQIVFGVRGVTGLQLTVYGPVRSLHSGHYGNWAPVPGFLLAELLATMRDREGRVAIEGFYDTVEPIGEAEREALARLPADDEALRRELGLARTEGGGAPLAERILLPSLTVLGLESGNVGAATRNVIPAEATAALGIRLVEGDDPARMLDLVEDHVRDQGYHVVREEPDLATRLAHPRIARIVRGGGYPAARTPIDLAVARRVVGAAARAAGERARPGSHPRRLAPAVPVHRRPRCPGDHRADRQPRRRPARARREPPNRQPVVRDRPVRRASERPVSPRVAVHTAGRSLAANLALLEHNAAVAGEIGHEVSGPNP